MPPKDIPSREWYEPPDDEPAERDPEGEGEADRLYDEDRDRELDGLGRRGRSGRFVDVGDPFA